MTEAGGVRLDIGVADPLELHSICADTRYGFAREFGPLQMTDPHRPACVAGHSTAVYPNCHPARLASDQTGSVSSNSTQFELTVSASQRSPFPPGT
jgi:hypothetical protein